MSPDQKYTTFIQPIRNSKESLKDTKDGQLENRSKMNAEDNKIQIPGYAPWIYQNDRQYISDFLQSTQSDHKFNVSFWKAILVWLEGRREEVKQRDVENFLTPLSNTLLKVYLERGVQYDSGLLKLTKFHLAAFLKLLKMGPTLDVSPTAVLEPYLAVLRTLVQLETDNTDLCELRNNFKKQLLDLLPKTTESDVILPEFLLIRELEDPQGDLTTAFNILRHVRDPTFKVALGTRCVLCNSLYMESAGACLVAAATRSESTLRIKTGLAPADRTVTLIHYTIIQMSSLCLSISSAQELETLERILVGQIQSDATSPLCTLVAGDILVYLAR
eukprot:sb/3466637/